MTRTKGSHQPAQVVDPILRQELMEAIHLELCHVAPYVPVFINERDLAQILQLDFRTLQNHRHAGTPVPIHTRISNRTLYRVGDVADFILTRRRDLKW